MTIPIHSKLPHVGTTIFAIMTQLSNDHGAINLSQGFPNFNPPEKLQQLVNHYIATGYNQYASLPGVPQLRVQIANKVAELYGRRVATDQEITVTNGATEALFVAISAIINPGDEAILFDPAYDTYEPTIELNGGRAIHLPLLTPNFAIDWQRVRDSITPNTRLIMLNTPHNPSGYCLNQADLDTLAEIIRDTNILLISDEVYEHIVFDGARHLSLLSHAELAERTFVISSFGKTYHTTGWKIGYNIAPPQLTAEFRKIHQFVVYSVLTPVQYALADFMEQCPEFHQALSAFYQEKRDYFCNLMKDSHFTFTPTSSTFFQLMDYRNISNLTDVEYAHQLTIELGVASIPISVFYQEKPDNYMLRFCFAKPEKTLAQAAEKLCTLK